jgi:hypothetical protein
MRTVIGILTVILRFAGTLGTLLLESFSPRSLDGFERI